MRHLIGRWFGYKETFISDLPFDDAYEQIDAHLQEKLIHMPVDRATRWQVRAERTGYGRAQFSIVGYDVHASSGGLGAYGSDGALTAINGDRTRVTLTKTVDSGILIFHMIMVLVPAIVAVIALREDADVGFAYAIIIAAAAFALAIAVVRTPLVPVKRALDELLQLGIYEGDARGDRKRKQSEAEHDDHWNDTPLLK